MLEYQEDGGRLKYQEGGGGRRYLERTEDTRKGAENARRRGLELSEQWKRRYCEDGGVEVVLEMLVGLELVWRPGGKGGGRY